MALLNDNNARDQIIANLREIKAQLAESMNFDVSRILDDARRKQQAGGRTILSPPQRKVARPAKQGAA